MRVEATARRRWVGGSLLGVGVVLVLALFLIANYFGWKYHTRLDWTSSRLYSLSEKSLAILAELQRDIDVVVFVSPAEQLYEPVSELLSAYEDSSDRISVRYVDPEKDLLAAQALVDQYDLAQLNVLVFDAGPDRRVVDTTELAEYDYSGMQFGEAPKMTGFRGEQVFTSTILELMESRKPKILFTTGHGEMALDDSSGRGLSIARDLLGRDNFDMEEWSSLGASALPPGTDLLVIAGPTSNFLEPELGLLGRYLEEGGRLLVLLDPVLTPEGGLTETGLEWLLGGYGVDLVSDVVVDPVNPLPFFGAETIFVDVYGDHVITRSLDQARLPVVVQLGRSVGARGDVSGLEVTELMMTSVEGWGETDLENLSAVEKQETDISGPVSLAVAVEAAAETDAVESDAVVDTEDVESEGVAGESGLRMVVVGDADLASNDQMQNVPNATFLANAFNWLVDRETLVGIPPRQPEQVRLNLTRRELGRISWIVLAGLPGLALVLGLGVYLRRRR